MNLVDKKQSVKLDGKISNNPLDKFTISFNHFNLSQLAFLIADKNIEVGGFLDGKVDLVDLYKSSNFITDINILNVLFNKIN